MGIGIGLSTGKDSLLATKDAVQQAIKNIGHERPGLAIIFSSIEFAHSRTIKTINSLMGALPLIGCTCPVFICNEGAFKHGIAVALLGFPEGVYFKAAAAAEINAKNAFESGEELGEKLNLGFKDIRRALAIILSDGLMEDDSGLIYGIQEKLGGDFPIMGVSASDNLRFSRTMVYSHQEIISRGACGVLWGGSLNYGLGIKHGWKPLGKPRRVTKAESNIVYEIDGAYAAKLYEEYLACDVAQLKKELKIVSIFYPIGVYIADKEEYLVRNIIAIRNDGALVCQGNVPADSQIRLMIGTKESCLEATAEAAAQAKKSLGPAKTQGVLVFNSISRYVLLGRDTNRELQIIKNEFGNDAPVLGFYTYGQQLPLNAVNYKGKLYSRNQTVNILAIGG